MSNLMSGSTLEELFQHTKAGDSIAFTALYRLTWQKLYQLAVHKCRDEEEAKDIVQDIYIQLWQKRASIHIRGSVEAYLYSMAKYELVRRMQRFLKDESHRFDYQQVIETLVTAADQQLFAGELAAQLSKEVKALPEKQQHIYRLYQEDNLSTGEIARELGLAEQTVKNQLVHAKRKIRLAIKDHILSTILFL